nr:ribonuclease H-like domain-containing protein [Tanacetum cinerariifolium]
MLKSCPLPVIKMPLLEDFPTAREEMFPLLSQSDAPAEEVCTAEKLKNEHYALWEVIKFGDSYQVPQEDGASESSVKKKGRTVAVTTEDMQKRKSDVKARTTLLLTLPDEHQLKFKGSETLEHTFNRLHAIISHLEFMDVEIEQDDLNQKFLTSLAPEWLIQNSSGKGKVNTASIPTASTQVSPASVDFAAASFSHDTVCTYIASQSNGSQIKYKDINQIDEDDIEEMDITWNMSLLSMRANRFWKKTGKKITIQGTDVAGFDKSKVECFNFHKMGHFARECRAPRSQDRGRRENYKQSSKVEESAPNALMAINGQPTLSRSSTEAEYRCMAAAATSEIIWICNILGEFGVLPVEVFCANISALQRAANPVFHEKSKHFKIDFHLKREKLYAGVVKTIKVYTSQQIADIFNKGVDVQQHKLLWQKLNLKDIFKVLSIDFLETKLQTLYVDL